MNLIPKTSECFICVACCCVNQSMTIAHVCVHVGAVTGCESKFLEKLEELQSCSA